ncbi:MAG: hypothetical protein WAV05_14075 [Anaerolineales bacterium]
MQKWEYTRIDYGGGTTSQWVSYVNNQDLRKDNINLYAYLNKLGEEGWELVSHDAQVIYLKRPTPSLK